MFGSSCCSCCARGGSEPCAPKYVCERPLSFRSWEAMLSGAPSTICPIRRKRVHSSTYCCSVEGVKPLVGSKSRINCSSLNMHACNKISAVVWMLMARPPSDSALCRTMSNLVSKSSILSRGSAWNLRRALLAFIRVSSPSGPYRSDNECKRNVIAPTCTPFICPPWMNAWGGMVFIKFLAPPRRFVATHAAFRASGRSSRILHSITSRVQSRNGYLSCMWGPHTGGPLLSRMSLYMYAITDAKTMNRMMKLMSMKCSMMYSVILRRVPIPG
eukprot:4821838-Pyramimonas_sp.AAC.2